MKTVSSHNPEASAPMSSGLRKDASIVGVIRHEGRSYSIPRIHVVGPKAPHEPIRFAFFGCVHGDELAGYHGLMSFVQALEENPSIARGYELFIYPMVNPVGHAFGTRENGNGKDLNREFWKGSGEAEVALLEVELLSLYFDGLVALHADDTCEGIYGYARGREISENILWPALMSAQAVLPRDPRSVIDGFQAENGLIRDCFNGVLTAPPAQHPKPIELILETPALAPLDLQIKANVDALLSILSSYRGFISYASNL